MKDALAAHHADMKKKGISKPAVAKDGELDLADKIEQSADKAVKAENEGAPEKKDPASVAKKEAIEAKEQEKLDEASKPAGEKKE